MNREEWLQSFTDKARPHFERVGTPLPATVRTSIGWPSKGQRSKVVGECWNAEAAGDNVCEIFIRPTEQSDTRSVAGTLTHELMHAAVGGKAGHGPLFGKPLKALGMEGPATHAGDGAAWWEWAEPIIKELGEFPGAALNGSLSGKKKQSTRLVKLECQSCGFVIRTTQKWIDKTFDGTCRCPDPDCGGEMA